MVSHSIVSSVRTSDNADARIRKTLSHSGASSSSRSSRHEDDNSSRVSGRSSRSRATTSSRRHEVMPVIVDVSDSEEWSSEGERWVLDQWERVRPTSTSGVLYDQRPGQHINAYDHIGRANRRSLTPYREDAARSQVSRHSSRASSRRDSDSGDEHRSRVSSSSRRSSRIVDPGESIDERLSRLSVNSEATLRIPDSYRPQRGPSSQAGSSASRSRSSRSSRGSGH